MTTIEAMTKAYFQAIYFTETGDTDQPPTDAELTAHCQMLGHMACRNFLEAVRRHPGVQDHLLDPSQLGHDLWLTRNGHGVGFWDRPEVYGQDLADWFTALATAMGSHDAEFDEDAETITQ